MDQFKLELATSNEDLVKVLRAFTKVEDKIDNFEDWSSGLERLEMRSGEDELEADMSSIFCIVLVALILPPLFVSSYVLLKMSIIWMIGKGLSKLQREEKETRDYSKLEENKCEAMEQEESDKRSRRCVQARKISSFLGQDVCLVLGLLFVLSFTGSSLEQFGCNTNSVQVFIGDGDMSLDQLGVYTEQALEDINRAMFSARSKLSTSVELLEKYDSEIQDIILTRIDRVTEKGDIITQRAANLAEYLEDCEVKKGVIGLSVLYFLSYVVSAYLGVRLSVSRLGQSLLTSLAYFLLCILSHAVLFVTSIIVWVEIFVPLLTMFVYSQSYEMTEDGLSYFR